MGEAENTEIARNLLEGLTTEDVRAVSVEALRVWRRGAPTALEFTMHGDLGRALVPLLAQKKEGIVADPQHVKEPFLYQQSEAWMQPIVEFASWLVRAGLAVPLVAHDTRSNGYTGRYRLTVAGARLVDGSGDHPLLPGFLERVRQRCPGLPAEVVVHLADARSCLDHGLPRPAVVLAGLAYEAAENDVIDYLSHQGKLKFKSKNPKAAERIAAVRVVLPTLLPDAEKCASATLAWDFGDILRRRRNTASHPQAVPDFTDVAEIHELLVSAGHHLPALWSVRI
jgi:hypothetical protein